MGLQGLRAGHLREDCKMTDFFSPTYACPNEFCDEAGYLVSSSGIWPLCTHCGAVLEEVDVDAMDREGMDTDNRRL